MTYHPEFDTFTPQEAGPHPANYYRPRPVSVFNKRNKIISVVPLRRRELGTGGCRNCLGNDTEDVNYTSCRALPDCEEHVFVLATQDNVAAYLIDRLEGLT